MQVDEPALAAVANAQVPTASGFGRHRRVDPPELSAHLEWVVAAIADAGAEAWVHSCAPQTPWGLVAGTGVAGLSADLDMLGPGDLDAFAEALESGRTTALGVVPSADPADRALRRAPHRAGAALARHARPRPRDRGGAPGGHPDLRAGRRHARRGRPRAVRLSATVARNL